MGAGGVARPHRFSGHQTVATAEQLEAWALGAAKGERFTYCSAVDLIRGETTAKAAELYQRRLITTHQTRRAGGGFDWFAVRTGFVVKKAEAQRDPARDAILAALKRAANFNQACPSDADLARIAGLATRDQAAWRVRKLVEAGAITSTVAYDGGVPFRVVTIAASGKRTALPPKWAAAVAAGGSDGPAHAAARPKGGSNGG